MLRSLIACVVTTLVFVAADGLFASPTPAANETVVVPAPAVSSAAPAVSPAAVRTLDRQAIRQMPLLMRPNRPGHFYGNTVRRLYYGR